MTRKTRYTYMTDGVIARNGETCTEFVSYIRFAGDRAEAIGWTEKAADAATGLDTRAFRAVQNFNRPRKFPVVGRCGTAR